MLEGRCKGGGEVELLKRRVREGVQVRAQGAVCRWKWHFWLVKRGSNGVTSVSHLPIRRLQHITLSRQTKCKQHSLESCMMLLPQLPRAQLSLKILHAATFRQKRSACMPGLGLLSTNAANMCLHSVHNPSEMGS